MSKSLQLRRSERATKGKIPARFMSSSENFEQENMPVQFPDDKPLTDLSKNQGSSQMASRCDAHTMSSNKTKSSTLRRKQLEIELEQIKKLAEIEKRRMEMETEMIKRESALKKAELEEQWRFSNGSRSNHTREEDMKTVTSKSSFVQQWVNSLQNPEANHLAEPELNLAEPYTKHLSTDDLKLNQFMARQSFNKDLPIFSGEPGQWMNFITQFKESTKICGFSNAENMMRLQKSLKGKAKDSVNALLSFTQEVDKILETLEKRFGRSEIIIQDLIESAVKIPNVKDDKIENMLEFSNKVQNLAVTINSLKGQEYLCNPQLLNDLVKKLSTSLRIEWGKRICELKKLGKSNPVNILEFSQWLDEIGEAAMYASVPEQDMKKKYVCTASLQNEKVMYKCKFCKKDGHKVEKL